MRAHERTYIGFPERNKDFVRAMQSWMENWQSIAVCMDMLDRRFGTLSPHIGLQKPVEFSLTSYGDAPDYKGDIYDIFINPLRDEKFTSVGVKGFDHTEKNIELILASSRSPMERELLVALKTTWFTAEREDGPFISLFGHETESVLSLIPQYPEGGKMYPDSTAFPEGFSTKYYYRKGRDVYSGYAGEENVFLTYQNAARIIRLVEPYIAPSINLKDH